MRNSPWRQYAANAGGALALAAFLSLATSLEARAAADGPTIRLFPTTVIEDIRQTGFVAQEMETGLQDVISRLDQQQELFLQSKCDGAENDPGCDQIARQLGDTYMEMLTVMGDLLPDMEHAVNGTRASLEKRLRTEIGNKMSPWTMQETLLGNRPDGTAKVEPRLRGRSGLRLSERFRQYHDLVAHNAGGSDDSLAVVAADIYLDMSEASDLIARTQQEISRATLMGQLNQSFGLITPEMQQVVSGVKSILFGDPDAAAVVAGPPVDDDDGVYRSPLEM
ncbi:MAG: hypothetical protein AAFN78_11060 [Pseudomonadota bacterium]